MNKAQQRRLEHVRSSTAQKYGTNSVNMGDAHYKLNVIPTGSLMLDYKLGIGGFPYGYGVEVYGANRIGKSSAIGYPVLANVIKAGGVPALLASEPRMVTPQDREWGLKLGFDPDMCMIQHPKSVEEAFSVLRDWVFGDLVDYIMIDSLGGLGTESSAKEDGKKKAYGISGEVTDGLNAIMPSIYRNNIGLLIINQQRQGQSPTPGRRFYESPGGEALHHHMRIRIHIKPGANKYKAQVNDDALTVGQELTCVMRKNNMTQGQEKTAKFDFFHIETEQHAVGVDKTQDVINVGVVSGVFEKAGSYYRHNTFPKGQIQGKEKIREFLDANPEAYEVIRNDVMTVMVQNELDAAERKRQALEKATVVQEKAKSDGE